MTTNYPSYFNLYHSGTLQDRVHRLRSRLSKCDLCPRECGKNRLNGELGKCSAPLQPAVASYCDHHGEEPSISGHYGSGTIFFAYCNLKCTFCQNHEISQPPRANIYTSVSTGHLANIMLKLKQHGCHNINFVSPSHYVPQIVEALTIAIPLGFNLPLVYNTNAYDSLATLEELNGIIDIYLPDLKYASNMMANKFSKAPGYVEIARAAIKEMFRQVDNLKINSKGIALRGLIVRHLILPNNLSGTNESLEWLAREISPFLTLSLMSQYHPSHHALENNLLNRPISREEYRSALQVLRKTRLNGWIQGLDSSRNYLPDFEVSSHPFEF